MSGRARRLVGGQALWAWLTARGIVLGALALSKFLATDLGARSASGRPTGGLTSWDAAFYVRIAADGYHSVTDEALRFFPLLPLLARAAAVPLGGRHDLAVLVVANLAALLAGVLVERLVLHETGDAALAGRAAWLLALAPPAFVLVMGYAEPLMIAAVAGGLLALRRRQWTWAAAAGFAAGLSRPLGVLFAVAALVEAAPGLRAAAGGERGRRLLAVLGAPLGVGAYLLWSEIALGDGLAPVRVQQRADLRGGFVDPLSRLLRAAGDLRGGDLVGSGLHLVWALLFLGLLVVLIRRWPVSFTALSAALLVAALSASNLDSLERYALSAVGFVLAAATVIRPVPIERAAYALAAAGCTAYATLAFLGAYVP